MLTEWYGNLYICMIKSRGWLKPQGDDWVLELEYDAQGRPSKNIENGKNENGESWKNIYTYFYDEYGFFTKQIYSSMYQGEESMMEVTYDYAGDTVFVTSKAEDVRVIEIYSEDMYQIYECHMEGDGAYKTESYYTWQDGNLVTRKYGENNEVSCEYDKNPNILHFFGAMLGYWEMEELCRNNRIKSGESEYVYEYDEKGMVISSQEYGIKTRYTYLYY